ncbi:pseudouridine-5-phosphate glycosidase [Acinetobacter sp. AM]|uniref:pseudouridine-5'-phosphate glycosidase n=1 Tax=Acinetobacter sp. AM TaxID=2170730 RepID=UPI000DE7A64F|nr:pseudouridine-5'-phosphate glycosidase [Acinetobacter sp. AM]PWB15057.1 pseudouridine-5-phosphate glycosidase [Acinetobacter sp. AM]
MFLNNRSSLISDFFKISEEVQTAIDENKAIVSLESNVLTHGLKYPLNIETITKIENSVRDKGVVPATIYIDQGKIIVGSNDSIIDKFSNDQSIVKVSSRDISTLLAKKESGATTVSASLVCSDLLGIEFFSSAGLGGVHREASTTFDISSDLIQITRSKTNVICAGVKNILDIGLTLEFLETQAIPVLTYKSEYFPAFFCQNSGFVSPCNINDINYLCDILKTHRDLNLQGGTVIAVPPLSKDALDSDLLKEFIDNAISRAKFENVSGKHITKFIMRDLEQKTLGKTSKANADVLVSNAIFAAELAKQYKEKFK